MKTLPYDDLQRMCDAKEQELQEIRATLPADLSYMDPPDGGSVTLVEQFQRMAADAAKWRAAQSAPDEREAVELALLREYRLSAIAFSDSHGVETDTLEEAVEIERKAEARLEAAEKACWDFYGNRGASWQRAQSALVVPVEHEHGARKVFICRDCGGVYADQTVSQCDCLGTEQYDEGYIVMLAAAPQPVAPAGEGGLSQLRDANGRGQSDA